MAKGKRNWVFHYQIKNTVTLGWEVIALDSKIQTLEVAIKALRHLKPDWIVSSGYIGEKPKDGYA